MVTNQKVQKQKVLTRGALCFILLLFAAVGGIAGVFGGGNKTSAGAQWYEDGDKLDVVVFFSDIEVVDLDNIAATSDSYHSTGSGVGYSDSSVMNIFYSTLYSANLTALSIGEYNFVFKLPMTQFEYSNYFIYSYDVGYVESDTVYYGFNGNYVTDYFNIDDYYYDSIGGNLEVEIHFANYNAWQWYYFQLDEYTNYYESGGYEGEFYMFVNLDFSGWIPSYANPPHVPGELPPDPVKEGYTFVGWYYDEYFTQPYDGAPITEDTDLYAKFVINDYTVSFVTNGGSSVAPISVTYNTIFAAPTTTRTHYIFLGWYKNSALTESYNFSTPMIASDFTLYAKWVITICTITFDTSGGFPVDSVSVDSGTNYTSLPTTSKNGYTFLGWSLNGSEFVGGTITSDITLVAEFAVIMCKVTFHVDDEIYAEVEVPYGTSLLAVAQAAGLSGVFNNLIDENGNVLAAKTAIDGDINLLVVEKSGGEKFIAWVANYWWFALICVGVIGVSVVLIIIKRSFKV
jgi:uncharacterized repeat protein (TIGR02543 family)